MLVKFLKLGKKSEIKQIIYCKRGWFEMFLQNIYIENMHYPIWSAHWLTIIYYHNILLSGVFRRIMVQEENAWTAFYAIITYGIKQRRKYIIMFVTLKAIFKNKF